MSEATNAPDGLASVVLTCAGRPAFTRLGLAALARHTRRPWELVLVGVGPPEVPAEVREAAVRVEDLTGTDGPTPAARDRGLEAARGGHLVLLDDDVVVTDGWLDQLVALAESDPKIGMTGPVCNDAPPPQGVGPVDCHDLPGVDRFAARWRADHRGQWLEAERLGGFCLLLKRGVWRKAGGLDGGLGDGFGADDLAARVRRAGFTPAVAYDLFVHRFSAWVADWSRPARSWDQVPGMFDFQAVYDAAVAGARDGAVFVEVGCLAGRSTCYLGARIRASGKAITLYAVDTATGSPSDVTGRVIAPALGGSLAGVLHRNLLGCGLADTVVVVLTDSARAAALFPDGGVDFCFIDGDHSYASVTADLRAWWPKVRPGGVLAGHDYRQSAPWLLGLTPAVHDFFGVGDAAHPAAPSCWAVTKPARPGGRA